MFTGVSKLALTYAARQRHAQLRRAAKASFSTPNMCLVMVLILSDYFVIRLSYGVETFCPPIKMRRPPGEIVIFSMTLDIVCPFGYDVQVSGNGKRGALPAAVMIIFPGRLPLENW